MELKNQSKNQAVSELRRDLVTGNWIVVAKGRGARPHTGKREKDVEDPIETCPFEDSKASGNADPVLIYKDGEKWSLQVIPNKFPAFAGAGCPVISKVGPYSVQDGLGYHEVIITRDHFAHLALLPKEKVTEVMRAYKERYLSLKKEECVKYISIFHNHGRGAGASLTHPHSQLVAIPILPSDIRRSLSGSSAFYKKHGKCVHCAMLDFEREDKKRIVFENNDFIAICPFISRDAYEVRIFPKTHSAYFEETDEAEISSLSEIFQEVLKSFYKNLENPPYNFYLHTAPIDGERYSEYHWHFEILPKTEIGAGFEMGTGIEIATVEPERAAEILRG
jgi:UDPglucose--hexose-1-phosphate uridylyltransferase